MRWNEADCHEQTTGERGIESKARGLYYFIRKKPFVGTLVGIGAQDGITYLTPAQAKIAALELAGIVEEYC